MLEDEFRAVEEKIDQLVALIQNLKQHNQALVDNETALMDERADLMKKNDLARTKVEAMISRLKTLEQS